VHCESLVHPARHSKSSGAQIGAVVPQSEFERHATQVDRATRHRGDAAGQSLFCVHWMHDRVSDAQIGRVAGQSLIWLQPMHAPLVESQIGVFPGQVGPPLHEAWHV
jgi:hypothetical protein